MQASPEEITNEVVRIVDTMFLEITKCHSRIRPIAVLLDGIATMYENAIPAEIELLIGSKTWQDYLMGKISTPIPDELPEAMKEELQNWLVGQILVMALGDDKAGQINKYAQIAEIFYKSWIKYSQKDRRLLLCINKARINWRSPLQIALLGL